MTIKAIAINKLLPSPKNVRKTKASAQADAELIATIKAHGVLQNLVVEPSSKKDHFEVLAGERRRQALYALVEQKHMKPTDTVDCKIIEESAEESSLIENTTRQAMHPADEFEAYQQLMSDGHHTEDQIAERFGVTAKHVKQRLRLAEIHPDIIQAFRKGEIGLDAVKAFTIESDKDKQLKVWKEVKGYIKNYTAEESAEEIKDQLSDSLLPEDDDLVKFVTLKSYKAAGGVLIQDLFGDKGFIADQNLLKTLAIEKLSARAEKIKKDGWLWVDCALERNYDNERKLHKLDAVESKELNTQLQALESEQEELDMDQPGSAERYDELDAKIDKLRNEIEKSKYFDQEQMTLAGCIIYVGHNGKLEITAGLVKKEQKPELDRLLNKDKKKTRATKPAAADDNSQKDHDQPPEEIESSIDMSGQLQDDLRVNRQAIIMAHVAANAEMARDLLYFGLCVNIFDLDEDFDRAYDTLDINATDALPMGRPNWNDIKDSKAAQELIGIYDSLKLSWRDEDPATAFKQFCALESTIKQRLMAYCVAKTITGQLAGEDADPDLEAAVAMLDIKWHHYWRPTAENFFSRITKDQLAALGAQHHPDPDNDWKVIVSKSNKAQLAAKVEELINTKAPSWMPEGFQAK